MRKQETLEEAIKREYETRKFNSDFPFDPQSFKLGAKWQQENQNTITENTSDGYHTFKELYEFRKVYNAALFNEWANYDIPKYDVHKSWKHYDGELCFGGGWFIVVALLPSGQISNHYEAKDWDLFNIPIAKKAKYAFDGHDSKLVIRRINNLNDLKK
jgi:hypothetical protein